MADVLVVFTSMRYDPQLRTLQDSGQRNAFGWNSSCASPFYMLDYHRDRMLEAVNFFEWPKAAKVIEGDQGLQTLVNTLAARVGTETAPQKLRITLSQDGELDVTMSPIPLRPVANLYPASLQQPGRITDVDERLGPLEIDPVWQVHIDSDLTEPSEYTHLKTTQRHMYDAARGRALLSMSSFKEVLLINKTTSAIMEGSITTPYFWRESRWVTPIVAKTSLSHDGSGGQNGTSRRWALEQGLAVEADVQASDVAVGEDMWLSSGARGFFRGRIVHY